MRCRHQLSVGGVQIEHYFFELLRAEAEDLLHPNNSEFYLRFASIYFVNVLTIWSIIFPTIWCLGSLKQVVFQVWNGIIQLRTESLCEMSHTAVKQLKEFESLISPGYIRLCCVYHWVNTQQCCGECQTISAHYKMSFSMVNYFSPH